MTTVLIPKMLSEKFIPGLGAEHEVGLSGVGVCVVEATLACNTAQTAAELMASPPNTGTAVACGPVVHSLGVAPKLTIVQQVGAAAVTGLSAAVTFQYCTADNSAVYVWPKTWTSGKDPEVPAGVRARVVALR